MDQNRFKKYYYQNSPMRGYSDYRNSTIFKTAVTFLFFEIQQAFKWNMKIQSMKKTFYCYLLTVSKFLHAQKRSLKKVIFNKKIFQKITFTSSLISPKV